MEVLPVTKPLYSVAMRWKKLQQGFHFPTEDDPEAYMLWRKCRRPLVERGGQYYLEVKLVKNGKDTMVAALDACGCKWCLVEWCCSENSIITTVFEEHGWTAMRLGEFNSDLSSPSDVKRVTELIKQKRAEGYVVLRWISLPWHSWSSWHYTDEHNEKTAARLAQQRAYSAKMVDLVCDSIEETMDGYVFNAFEWPRKAIPWCRPFPAFRRLLELLPMEVDFDGCCYGLCSDKGYPVQKGWRLRTDLLSLLQLNRRCTPALHHRHQHCRGKLAKRTELYTRELAEEVFRLVADTEFGDDGHVLTGLEREAKREERLHAVGQEEEDPHHPDASSSTVLPAPRSRQEISEEAAPLE